MKIYSISNFNTSWGSVFFFITMFISGGEYASFIVPLEKQFFTKWELPKRRNLIKNACDGEDSDSYTIYKK